MNAAHLIEQLQGDIAHVFDRYQRMQRGRILALGVGIVGLVLVFVSPTFGADYGVPVITGGVLMMAGFLIDGRVTTIFERGRR